MAVVFKRVRPSKLKQDVYRLEFLNAMHKAGRGIKKDYEACVDGWEHKVEFKTTVSTQGGNFEVLVDTNDEIFAFVDRGTAPHMIFPKSADGVLVFPWDGYGSHTPKTVPNWLGTFAEQVPSTTVFKLGVSHPGNEARNFTKMLEEQWQPKFKQMMQEAMHVANQKSGHARSK